MVRSLPFNEVNLRASFIDKFDSQTQLCELLSVSVSLSVEADGVP